MATKIASSGRKAKNVLTKHVAIDPIEGTPSTENQGERMPTGPQGQKRPSATVPCAIKVMKIATGEIEEDLVDPERSKACVAGGVARSKALSKDKRQQIAKKAAAARWGK